jgi:ABC-type uncharacterized transport system substrate-binding protein
VDRRAFLAGTGAVLLAAPLAAEAQQARVYRVGVLLQLAPVGLGVFQPLESELGRLGYIVGRNLVIHARWVEGKVDRFPGLAAEVVALKPDVIVAETTSGTTAAARKTATIPIVGVNVANPVGSGLVRSLVRPGGNVTAVTDFALDLSAKRLELLHAVAPTATRIAVMMNDHPLLLRQLKTIQEAAEPLGLTIVPIIARSPEEIEAAFASLERHNAGGIMQLGAPVFAGQRDKVLALTAKSKLPTIYQTRFFVDAGGLMGYGPSLYASWKRAAVYVDKILKGANPADLPVQQPTEVELVINLKTAKALGLTIPPSLLGRADEVIQ